MKALVEGVFKEIRLIPHTAVAVLGLVGVLSVYVLPGVRRSEAVAADVSVLKRTMGDFRLELVRNRIATLDSRLTSLELEKARVERLGQPVPDVITDLLRRATTERAIAEQELGVLLNRGQDANEP